MSNSSIIDFKNYMHFNLLYNKGSFIEIILIFYKSKYKAKLPSKLFFILN